MPGTVEVGTFFQRPKGRKTVEAARDFFSVSLCGLRAPRPSPAIVAALVREW